jgi:hypothetical protein
VAVHKAILLGAFFGLGLSFGFILCTLALILRNLKEIREQRGRSTKLDLGFVFALWLAALPLLVLATFGRMYIERDFAHEVGPLVSIASAVALVALVNRFVSSKQQQARR